MAKNVPSQKNLIGSSTPEQDAANLLHMLFQVEDELSLQALVDSTNEKNSLKKHNDETHSTKWIPEKVREGRPGEYTLITINFRSLLGEDFTFLLPFAIFFFTRLDSKLYTPTKEPDNLHLTPTIFKMPSTLGVTISCTWKIERDHNFQGS